MQYVLLSNDQLLKENDEILVKGNWIKTPYINIFYNDTILPPIRRLAPNKDIYRYQFRLLNPEEYILADDIVYSPGSGWGSVSYCHFICSKKVFDLTVKRKITKLPKNTKLYNIAVSYYLPTHNENYKTSVISTLVGKNPTKEYSRKTEKYNLNGGSTGQQFYLITLDYYNVPVGPKYLNLDDLQQKLIQAGVDVHNIITELSNMPC